MTKQEIKALWLSQVRAGERISDTSQAHTKRPDCGWYARREGVNEVLGERPIRIIREVV